MLHNIQSNQRTSSSKTSFTMNSYSSFFSLGSLKELLNNVVGRGGTIKEIQIEMFDSIFCEFLFVILCLVESYNKSYPHLFENRNVIVWSEGSIFICDIKWTRE